MIVALRRILALSKSGLYFKEINFGYDDAFRNIKIVDFIQNFVNFLSKFFSNIIYFRIKSLKFIF